MDGDFSTLRESAAQQTWLAPEQALARFVAPSDLLWREAENVQQQKRYGYRIASLNLLIRAETGSEVMRDPAISSLPGAPRNLLGLMNLRGNLVPVFDLRCVLELGEGGDSKLVLILGKGEQALGMVIDAFPQPLGDLKPILRRPSLPALLQEHVAAAYVQDEKIWLEFAHDSFFEKLSRHQLAN